MSDVQYPFESSDIEQSGGVALSVENLRKEFGGLVAVDGLDFEVESGSLTGLIGPNGAGKSTTFNLIMGTLSPDGGTVRYQGEDVTDLPPYAVSAQGLVRTYQITREFETMTVLENLMLAPRGQRGERVWHSTLPGLRGGVKSDERELFEAAWEMLEFFEIDHLALENAGNLSGGQRKLLELARALMLEPDMVLLDEPFAGVNPSLENRLIAQIEDLRDRGYTFLLVEHDMDIVMEHCESVIVMHQGQKLMHGSPDDVRTDERVLEAYLGGSVE